MKTSDKILIAYVAVIFVFYTVTGLLNVSRTRRTLPIAENLCQELNRTPVRVIDLRGASGYRVDVSEDSFNRVALMSFEPGTLTFRGDTLVVRGDGMQRNLLNKKVISRIFIPTLTTKIDAEGAHRYPTKAGVQQAKGKSLREADAPNAGAAETPGAASPETPGPGAGSPNP